MSAFDAIVHAIRKALVPPGAHHADKIIRDERYPANVTINKRELHELTIEIDGTCFQINVQEQPK